ncbi:MAG: GntR family transcriptional regulator [Spirochaetales bacterium]|nr:GntR family transcriptional regulator [Spirochaetales bacterium]
MFNLQPIKLLPARERVASSLRKAIISKELKEGTQITLDSIASSLGVSRTPVREAFQMLENEGLIKLSLNKGATILGITPQTVREHFQIRAALESETVAIVCKEKKDLSEIRKIVEQSEEAVENGELEVYNNLNQAFHVAIWTASGNMRMKNMLSVMWNGLSMQYMETLENYARKSSREHRALLTLIESGDVDGARNMMHRHISRSMNDMLTNLESNS